MKNSRFVCSTIIAASCGLSVLALVQEAKAIDTVDNGAFDTDILSPFNFSSGTTIPLGGSWQEFSFTSAGVLAMGCSPADPSGLGCAPSSAGNSVFVGSPSWNFLAPSSGVKLTVTDAFLRGDVFDIFDFGSFIGSTSDVSTGGSCVPNETNPDDCLVDPLTSSGTFLLESGEHEITIIPKASPFGSGAAYFRVDARESVPEPASVLGLLAVGTLGATSTLKRKKKEQA
ncbi:MULTISPECIES: PEP-CTERM sorting domain-containing protein [unclassified Coleofasciculus]|uniref:PEP-CTERM sorting domain-containing protein n=1 Tax=unclassified Coleofasciculus TaxID=2692782 RepID=UPI001D146D57|nr:MULTISPECIES: PEP-CTERM sorting domain-containing protein [unclassified Coleofasciculus]